MKGRAAAHTGKQNGNWAGSRQGTNYTVQANIMVGPEVVDAVAATFEATEGTGMPLAERMILALEAGHAKGGDRRWGNLQSAAIKIADPNDPGRGGDYIALAIEVGEHPEPVAEMKRIYYTTGRRLGYRTLLAASRAPDVIELKRMLHALGYWRPSLAAFPERAAVDQHAEDAGAAQDQPGAVRQARSPSRARRTADYTRDYGCTTRKRSRPWTSSAPTAISTTRATRRGLSTRGLVDALRAAYLEKKRASEGGPSGLPT